MSTHSRRLITLFLHSGICVATVLGALHADAATLGHSRVTSAPDEPLRIVVQVKDLNATDLKSISAQIAPAAAWQGAGLKPPVELNSLSTHLLPGLQDNVMQLVLQSHLASTDQVVDILVDLSTDASTQRHQVSVLQVQRPAALQLAVTEKPLTAKPVSGSVPEPMESTVTTHTVKKGQNLYGIARTLRDERYNDQQMMAALVEANPQAFIQGNMNLLRAGAHLAIPDTETVAAISPQQARQLYQAQLEQFDEYRQRIAKGEPPVTVPSPTTEIVVNQDSKPELESGADRLQLSAESDEDAKKDQQTATAQELAHTAQRLSQLEAAESVVEAHTTSSNEQNEDLQQILNERSSAVSEPLNTTELKAEEAVNITPVSSTAVSVSNNEVMASGPSTVSFWKTNAVGIAIGIFVLLVLLVAWFLRRAYSTRMEYAEIVPASAVRTREKADTAEAEFREIN